MHSTHQNGATDRRSMADRLTQWLLAYCPMSTLALLILLAVGATVSAYWPWPVLVTAVLFDLGLNLSRRRRTKRSAHLVSHPRVPVG